MTGGGAKVNKKSVGGRAFGALTALALTGCTSTTPTWWPGHAATKPVLTPLTEVPPPYRAPIADEPVASAITAPVPGPVVDPIMTASVPEPVSPPPMVIAEPLTIVDLEPEPAPVIAPIVAVEEAPVITESPLPDVTTVAPLTYTVKKGDSLWKIGWMHGVSMDEVASANSMKLTDTLSVGRTLTLPPGAVYLPVEQRAKIRKRKTVARKSSRSKQVTPMAAAITTRPKEAVPAGGKYIVKKGDSLWKVSRRFGVPIAQIQKLNNIRGTMIRPSQVLVLSDAARTGVTAQMPTASVPSMTAQITPAAAESRPVPSNTAQVAEVSTPAPAPAEASAPSTTLPHIVGQADSLESIAKMYGSQKTWILASNPGAIGPDGTLKAGAKISVPCEF